MRAAIAAVFLLSCFASLSSQEQTGAIVFYREPHFAGSNAKPPWVFCDGMELARIQNGTYFKISAPEGPHNCTVESLQRPVIEINVLAGQVAYVHVEIQPGFKNHAVIANTTESEYNKQEARLKPVKEWSRNALRPAQAEGADSSEAPAAVQPSEPPSAADNTAPTVTSDRDAGAHPQHELRVFLTNRKSWLASGGFTMNGVKVRSIASDFTKDFHKGCPKLAIADMQDTADYAVTIDGIGTLDALTGPANQPTFKVAVYSRDAGLLYSGGTQLMRNAVKDACNAIGAK